MRASRLVNLLLLLQTRGRMTAAQLAVELEVSERTIYRDIDALSAAGIPLFAERGPHGGVQLIDGYRTRLTGMTGEEAEALFLSGVPGPAAELGLGTVMAAARLKVLAALPPELRSRASRLVERFHLDVAGWFHVGDSAPFLSELAAAVWHNRVVEVDYQRGEAVVQRRLHPLGVVLKGGIWYVVAQVDDQLRTYRASRVSDVRPTADTFPRPAGFDLAAFWAEATSAYERGVPRVTVTLRIDPERMGLLADLAGIQAVRRAEQLTPPAADPDGWQHLRLQMDWPSEAAGRLLALGDSAEVLEPAEVRAQVLGLASRVVAAHAQRSDRPVAAPPGVAALPAGSPAPVRPG
ncbi:MAG TPA: WYL domain-containing protein [Candidatus Limnocylindria bacterium]|nr:WYL domain-containing protein [Candidatus Limnocylindria bacterium]